MSSDDSTEPRWLANLPPPPPGRHGWPWTVESSSLPPEPPWGGAWPRVTVVTPSLNQATYLEETIRSVLLQGYPNLEYMVIDGGSSDGSVDVIRKYERWLAYWVSEPDRGQAEAINKGFRRATGEILAWLNSDDFYLPGALVKAVEQFAKHREAAVVHGPCQMVSSEGRVLGEYQPRPFAFPRVLGSNVVAQPAAFITGDALSTVGLLREDLSFSFDWELWLRLGRRYRILGVRGRPWAAFRLHRESKTGTRQLVRCEEHIRILEQLVDDQAMASWRHRITAYLGEQYWAAAINSWAMLDHDRSNRYLAEALRWHPACLRTPLIAREIVGALRGAPAGNMTVGPETEQRIARFFHGIPDGIPGKHGAWVTTRMYIDLAQASQNGGLIGSIRAFSGWFLRHPVAGVRLLWTERDTVWSKVTGWMKRG